MHLRRTGQFCSRRSRSRCGSRWRLPSWLRAATATAQTWLERIASAGHERGYAFVPYVRCHFLLATLYEARGDPARARQLYARFVDFWRDGEIDRPQVAEAQRKLTK